MKTVTLSDFLTQEQIEQAAKIYNECVASGASPVPRIAEEVIKPNAEEIERKTGMKILYPYHLSYCVEFVISRADSAVGAVTVSIPGTDGEPASQEDETGVSS